MGGGDYPGPGAYSVGSEVAGYRLEEQIGQGGMALVYRARDVQLGRNVALKLLSPTLGSDESFRERFIRESRAAAAVDHPNIIPIFAAGQSDGVLYIAMRFVQGGDVRELVDQLGPLSGDRATGIIAQVASALDAAHLHGLVHRDIKPANLLFDEDGRLFIDGRDDDMIISGGENVFPGEIEELLITHEAITEASVPPRRRSA